MKKSLNNNLMNSNNIADFITIILPIIILGLNYVLYNALGISQLKLILRVGAISLLLFGLVIRKVTSVDVTQLIFIALIIIQLLINGSAILNIGAAVIFAICNKFDNQKTEIVMFKINLCLVIFMLILLLLGKVENYTYISTMGRLRSTLGFDNPNVSSLFYSSSIFMFLLSRTEIKISHCAVAFVLEFVVYYFTDCRTGFLSLFIFIILSLLYRTNKRTLVERMSIIIIDFFFLLNLISVFTINKFAKLDALLSGRISSFIRMIDASGVKGFWFGGTDKSVDNFYYMFLFSYGVIMYVFMSIVAHVCLLNLNSQKAYKEAAFIVSYFALGFMESSIIRPEIISVLMIWKLLVKSQLPKTIYNNLDDTINVENQYEIKKR